MKLRGFGDLLKDSWELYTSKFSALVILFALPFVANVVEALLSRRVFPQSATDLSTAPHLNLHVVVAVLVAAVIFGLVSIWIQAATILLIDSGDNDLEPSEALAKGWSLLGPLLVVAILTTLAVIGGIILVIVPGLIFAIWFAFASYGVVLEGQRGPAAMAASKDLVRGRFGAVLGRFALMILTLLAAYVVVNVIAAIFGGLDFVVAALAASFVFTPLETIFVYQLYKELKAHPPAASVAEPTTTPAA